MPRTRTVRMKERTDVWHFYQILDGYFRVGVLVLARRIS